MELLSRDDPHYKAPPSAADPYCLRCAGYGYYRRGADLGFIFCVDCHGRQRRPVEDYEIQRRKIIEAQWDALWELQQRDPQLRIDTVNLTATSRRRPIARVVNPPARRRAPRT